MSGSRPRKLELEHFKHALLQQYEECKGLVQRNRDVALLKAEGQRCREEFLQRACLEPPSQVRLIDCHATCEENQVVLMDWHLHQQVEFAAISHTFGMEVYAVFDCECTTKCFTKVPRCSPKPCPGHAADTDPRNRVVKDILNMCTTLKSGGVEYAWHDGVCIAQHNSDEVEDTSKHIGWIYSYARETIIFLHYVGEPMAPIRPDRDFESRWQTRVWTLQEAALSRCRRYCLRVGTAGREMGLSDCKSLQEFEDKIGLWYRDDSSTVTILDEETFWRLIMELYTVITPLCTATDDPATSTMKPWVWAACIGDLVATLIQTCFQFPTVAVALDVCSARDSKHEGDRINSILALAGVKDFIAPKDGHMEASTIEFFRRQGQQGLARALFTANVGALKAHLLYDEDGRARRVHSWVPILSSPLKTVYERVKESSSGDLIEGQVNTSSVESFMKFTVLEDGKLEVKGEMACIAVQFTYVRAAREHDMIHMLSTAAGDRYAPSGPLVVLRGASNSESAFDPPGASIAMHLTFGMDGFSSALAQARSLELGTALVPMISHKDDDVGQGKAGDNVKPRSCCGAACRWAGELLGKAGRAALSCYSSRPDTGATGHDARVGQYVAGQQYAAQAACSLLSDGTFRRACSTLEPGWMQTIVPPGTDREVAAAVAMDAPVRAELTRVPALQLGSAIFPRLSSGRLGPLVQGREMQEGESFWAHMVLPLPALLQHQAFTASRLPFQVPVWDWSVPALLVQGDLNALLVAKVGCFHLTKELKDVCTLLLPALTKLHKLVII